MGRSAPPQRTERSEVQRRSMKRPAAGGRSSKIATTKLGSARTSLAVGSSILKPPRNTCSAQRLLRRSTTRNASTQLAICGGPIRQPLARQWSVGPNGNGVGNSPNIEPGSTTPPLAPGTKADSEGDLKAKFGDEILCQKHLPDSGAQSVKSVALRGVTLCLTATPTAVCAQKTLRVWLHNKASQNASVPAGTLIGQGG